MHGELPMGRVLCRTTLTSPGACYMTPQFTPIRSSFPQSASWKQVINLWNEILVHVLLALGVGEPSLSVTAHPGLSYLLHEVFVQVCPRDQETAVVHRPSNPYIGIQFADTTVWLAMATVLAVFRISKVVEGGVEVTPEAKYTDSAIM